MALGRSAFRAGLLALGYVLGSCTGDASAQTSYLCPAPSGPLLAVLPAPTCPSVLGRHEAEESPPLSPGRAFLYSALVPGLAQRKLGKGRWLAYLAIESAAWIAFGHHRWSATRSTGEYRDLAWEDARLYDGPRIDGNFRYYESMEKFLTSGAFDTDLLTPGIQPEMDPSTFNGRAWALATQIHFPPGKNPVPGDPEYEAALADYQTRAYDERFEWSWVGQSAALTDYKDLIDSSDRSFRRASQFLGVVVANHLLSGVDAFVTARIRGSGRSRTDIQILLLPPDDRDRLGLVLQVRH